MRLKELLVSMEFAEIDIIAHELAHEPPQQRRANLSQRFIAVVGIAVTATVGADSLAACGAPAGHEGSDSVAVSYVGDTTHKSEAHSRASPDQPRPTDIAVGKDNVRAVAISPSTSQKAVVKSPVVTPGSGILSSFESLPVASASAKVPAASPEAGSQVAAAGSANSANSVSSAKSKKPTGVKHTADGSIISKAGFKHPGVYVDHTTIKYMESRLLGGDKAAVDDFNKMVAQFDSPNSVIPYVHRIVNCGSFDRPNHGCTDLDKAVQGVYAQTLLWELTHEDYHAQKAIRYINDWSHRLKAFTGVNAPLQAAWFGEMSVRSEELLHYDYKAPHGETKLNVHAFNKLLRNVVYKELNSRAAYNLYRFGNGNADLAKVDAQANIAIALDNRPMYDAALKEWKARVDSYIYLQTDNHGNGRPIPPPGHMRDSKKKLTCQWLNRDPEHGCAHPPKALHLVPGQMQETCRDSVHTGLAIAAMFNLATTAQIQGKNLFEKERVRLVEGLNTAAAIDLQPARHRAMCNGQYMLPPHIEPTFEGAYQALTHLTGARMPNVLAVIRRERADGGTGVDHNMADETLTNGDRTRKRAPVPRQLVPHR